MKVLGIETSCDETAAAVVADGREVLADVVASQDALHAPYGGVVPELAARTHTERLLPVAAAALRRGGVRPADLDAVAVTYGPGLVGALLVGLTAAKTLAWLLGRPLVGVHHVEAHLYAARLLGDPPAYPYLGLIVSGGHTCLLWAEAPGRSRLLGSTRDDAAGEAFDKAAALLGLPFPGGPHLARLARRGRPDAHPLPRSLLGPDSLDFSFSGLKTALLYTARGQDRAGRGPLRPEVDPADLAASFEAAVVEVLVTKLARAVAATGAARVALGGGVAANDRLRAAVTALGASLGFRLYLPPRRLCVDNAAMVAGLGGALLAGGRTAPLTLDAEPTPIRR